MSDHPDLDQLTSPVSMDAQANAPATGPQPGIALCLSGGGYRAMLFHLGTLWRLNAAGILPKLARISSVSGGSITAGVLGESWTRLNFDANGISPTFGDEVVAPLRRLAGQTIFDRTNLWTTAVSLVEGLFDHNHVVQAYRDHLFGAKTLQDLPGDGNDGFTPRFVFNATNLGSGSLWRFSKPFMADWRVGIIDRPTIGLAEVVAASSAFPIGLPPVHLRLDPASVKPSAGASLNIPPYTEEAWLVDGGVYDNMGIETAWKEYKAILVSDAGGVLEPEPRQALGGRDPARVFSIIDNQVGSLRKRQIIRSYQLDATNAEHRDGAYWGIGSDIRNYGLPDGQYLSCPYEQTTKLAHVGTVLQPLDVAVQERLVNWGFAICDVALRKHCVAVMQSAGINLAQPQAFPYPAAGVG